MTYKVSVGDCLQSCWFVVFTLYFVSLDGPSHEEFRYFRIKFCLSSWRNYYFGNPRLSFCPTTKFEYNFYEDTFCETNGQLEIVLNISRNRDSHYIDISVTFQDCILATRLTIHNHAWLFAARNCLKLILKKTSIFSKCSEWEAEHSSSSQEIFITAYDGGHFMATCFEFLTLRYWTFNHTYLLL